MVTIPQAWVAKEQCQGAVGGGREIIAYSYEDLAAGARFDLATELHESLVCAGSNDLAYRYAECVQGDVRFCVARVCREGDAYRYLFALYAVACRCCFFRLFKVFLWGSF